ncbi:MAG TPA: DNA primase [Candidatus Moranbacteria bacterium]|nr:DNA primase [Candidatus Moranbacteria bacterium]HRZ33470.1 DNA primase [Candidatus Moranbacteria bacterium]
MNKNVEEIKSRLNIVDVVGEYVRLTKAGANWKGLCPFHHEKTPSFTVNEEKQIFHCFGCTKGGDVLTFIQEIESIEFREALKMLAEKAGVELEEYKSQDTDNKKRILEILELGTKFYETQLWKGAGKDKILKYLYDRGLTEESIKKFRLGYAPEGWINILNFLIERGYKIDEINKTGLLVEKSNEAKSHKLEANYYDRFRDRIIFPIQDIFGNVIGFSARVAPGGDESQAKYVNTPETAVYHKSKALYGISHAKNEIKNKNYTLLVEGNMDVIAASQAGIQNAVAVSGIALTADQIIMLKRYSQNLAMLFDMDSAGQQAAEKSADLCFEKDMKVKIVALSDGKDAADVVKKDPQLLLKAVKESVGAMEYFFNLILKKYDKNSASGKNGIAKEILAHVSHIENKIEKSHWVKKISHELDVEENVINNVLKEVVAIPREYAGYESEQTEKKSSFQKRSDLISESLIGVILSSSEIWKGIFEKERENESIKNDELLWFVLKKGPEAEFSFDKMLTIIEDDQIVEKLRRIYFETKYRFAQEEIVEQTEEELKKLADGYMVEYNRELQKEKIRSIIKEIEKAENKGDKETLAKLMSEFTKLSQEIQ